ncbi:MAG: hypothetical protein Q7S09_05330 [bacterium]|nr:hypothetical protein [bacterium]
MNITLMGTMPIEEAFERLRNAPLEAAGTEKIFIYRDATMRLCDFSPDELNPASLYVLKKNLETQRQIRAHFLQEHGIDTLQLSQVLHLRVAGKDGERLVGMAPPFVEIQEERVKIVAGEGERSSPENLVLQIPILQDGIHRAHLAREAGVLLRCVVIQSRVTGYPLYAYPNHWSEVVLCDETPKVKKYYRREDPYTFMRPYTILQQISNPEAFKPEWGR